MTMNPEIKARWLERLRSGEIPQTQGVLHRVAREKPDGAAISRTLRQPGLCCLGVLCEIAVEEGVIERYTYDDGTQVDNEGTIGYLYQVEDEGTHYREIGTLPPLVWEWAGLPGHNPDVPHSTGGEIGLAALNDGGHTFDMLADIIEEHL